MNQPINTPERKDLWIADIKALLATTWEFRPHIALDADRAGKWYSIDFLTKDCSLTCSEWYLGQIVLGSIAYGLYKHTQTGDIVGFYLFNIDENDKLLQFIKQKIGENETLFLDEELADMILSSIQVLNWYTKACNYTVDQFSDKVLQILQTYLK